MSRTARTGEGRGCLRRQCSKRYPLGAIIGISREFPDVDLLGAFTPKGQAMVASAADVSGEHSS